MMKIGASTYSFKRFDFAGPEEAKWTLEDIIRKSHEYGLDGIEILTIELTSDSHDYLSGIKQLAKENNIELYAMAVLNNFIHPDELVRENEVIHVKHWIKIAAFLEIPIVRVFGGRWGTIKDFRELMEQNGNEPPLEGYSYQDGINWNVACIQECIQFAKEYGITIAIENHWGLTFCAEGVLDIIDGVGDELKVALDCGNFRDNTYAQLEALLPYTVLVHIKTYWGGGLFYDFNLHPDYARIIQMLRRANYMGYLSIEYEGKLPSGEGIPQSIKLLKELT